MLRILFLALGLTGALTNLCAQNLHLRLAADHLFNVPEDSIDRRFRIDLGKSNVMQLELHDLSDLYRIDNVDSIILTFLGDIKPLQDSLADPLSAKRIDYLIDAEGRKKIRIRQTRPEGSSWLLDREGLASLKLEQDTLVITMRDPLVRLTFYLNQWNELPNYVATGLSEKLRLLRMTRRPSWGLPDKDRRVHFAADPSISAEKFGGYTHRPNDYMETYVTANVQNYQSYFSPSLSLGFRIHVGNNIFHPTGSALGQPNHNFGLSWEPMFFFVPSSSQGHLQVLRNDFLVLDYRLETGPRQNNGLPSANIVPGFSFGWLIYRQGDYFDKNSFRFAIGSARIWGNSAVLQPCIYFHDFFRTVTPGLRLSVHF